MILIQGTPGYRFTTYQDARRVRLVDGLETNIVFRDSLHDIYKIACPEKQLRFPKYLLKIPDIIRSPNYRFCEDCNGVICRDMYEVCYHKNRPYHLECGPACTKCGLPCLSLLVKVTSQHNSTGSCNLST